MPYATELPLPPTWTEPPALIAKAKVEMRKWGRVTLSDEPGFKKVITSCLDVAGSTHVNVTGDVLTYLGYRFDPKAWKYIPPLADEDVKFSVLEQPKHGRVGESKPGARDYRYWLTDREADGSASYHGWDKVVYQVEVKGQKLKVVFDLLSVPDSDADGGQICELRPRVKKGWASLANPGLDNWLDSARLSAVLAAASGVNLSLAPLPGSTLGLTQGEGASATSTLDPNAIGHIELLLQEPLPATAFTQSRILGSLILVDTASHKTSGAVLVN